jgi:hypothetical protein
VLLAFKVKFAWPLASVWVILPSVYFFINWILFMRYNSQTTAAASTFKKADAFINCVLCINGEPVVLPNGLPAKIDGGLRVYADTFVGKTLMAWFDANPDMVLTLQGSMKRNITDEDIESFEIMANPFAPLTPEPEPETK